VKIRSSEELNDIENQTHDLPACSIVPQIVIQWKVIMLILMIIEGNRIVRKLTVHYNVNPHCIVIFLKILFVKYLRKHTRQTYMVSEAHFVSLR
jgi:hypothetical protein